MSCEHNKHEGDECYHCGATAWLCVSDFREQRDDARALIAELRAALEDAIGVMNACEWCSGGLGVAKRIVALLERTKPQ